MIVVTQQRPSFLPSPTELLVVMRPTLVLWPHRQNLYTATFGPITSEVLSFMQSDQEKVPDQEGEVEGEEE